MMEEAEKYGKSPVQEIMPEVRLRQALDLYRLEKGPEKKFPWHERIVIKLRNLFYPEN